MQIIHIPQNTPLQPGTLVAWIRDHCRTPAIVAKRWDGPSELVRLNAIGGNRDGVTGVCSVSVPRSRVAVCRLSLKLED